MLARVKRIGLFPEAYFFCCGHSFTRPRAKLRNALIEISGLIDPFLWWLQATAFAQPCILSSKREKPAEEIQEEMDTEIINNLIFA